MDEAIIEEELRRILKPEMADKEDCSKDLYRYAAGECNSEEASLFQKHLLVCTACQQDFDAFRKVSKIEAKAPRRFLLSLRWLFPVTAMAVAVIVVVTWNLIGVNQKSIIITPETTLRIKGGCKLHIAVKRKEKRLTAKSGFVFREGDVLGFFYTAPADKWLVVLFADNNAKITRIFPSRENVSVPAGVEKPLPDGAILEKGKGCEWLIAFFADNNPDIKQLESALQRAISNQEKECALPEIKLESTVVDVFILRRDNQ